MMETPSPIAIVGIGARLPGGVDSACSLWDLLVNKRDGRGIVPPSRYNIDGFYKGTKSTGTVASKYGYFLQDDIAGFDGSFFSMSKLEVDRLDPQQRMLLEVVWECMESGGQKNWRGGNVGCYVGVFGDDWLDMGAKDAQNAGLYRIAGSESLGVSNRISYEYDLTGPSMTIRTACSSSLVALHEAVNAIRSGDCDSAIVAGANLLMTPTMTMAMAEQGVLSPEGISKSFDASADGYARGEGIAVVFLKPLKDAIKDGDPIRSVIRSTATNNDGKTPGISMPSSEAHEAMIRHAYKIAGITDFTQTGFVECHATGTAIGDPLEARAIARVFGSERGMIIGSIKPNLGHSEGCSGLSSLIKATLALENKMIAPNIHFNQPNPQIPFQSANLTVPIATTPWPKDKSERASINSFGIGGSNAHVILESAASFGLHQQSNPNSDTEPQLLIYSANDQRSINETVRRYEEYADSRPGLLRDLAYTLALRRDHNIYRAFSVRIGSQPVQTSSALRSKFPPRVVLVFTGQGAQWAQMGVDMLSRFHRFAQDIDEMQKSLLECPHPPSWSILGELKKSGDTTRLASSEFAQPLLTVIQVGLVNLLFSWGVVPAAVVGHSSGEIAAAYASGAISMAEAVIIAYYRGRATTEVNQHGGMVAVGLGKDDVTEFLKDGVVVACENSPQSVTLSGDKVVLQTIMADIRSKNSETFVRELKVEMAYHSHHMKGIGKAYEGLLGTLVHAGESTVSFYSSVSGNLKMGSSVLGASYWRGNLESPVLFNSAVNSYLKENTTDTIFVEVGPHSALAGPMRQIFKAAAVPYDVSYAPCLERGKSSSVSMLSLAGTLWQRAIILDFATICPKSVVLTDLPNYPWSRETIYWSETRAVREWRCRKYPRHELLGARILEGTDLEPTWRCMLRLEDVPWINDHRVGEDVVFPAAGYVAMAGEATRQLSSVADYTLQNFLVQTALVLKEGETTEIVTSLRASRLTDSLESSWYDFSITSFSGTWMTHCSGQIKAGRDKRSVHSYKPVQSFPRSIESPYDVLKSIGLNYGTTFQGLTNTTANPGAKVAAGSVLPPTAFIQDHYQLHPTSIDSCIQLFMLGACDGVSRRLDRIYVPTKVGRLYIGEANPLSELQAVATATTVSNSLITGHATAATKDGNVVLELTGGHFSAIDGETAVMDNVAGAELYFAPDIDLYNPERLIRPREDPDVITGWLQAEVLCLLCMIEIKESSTSKSVIWPHLDDFISWVATRVGKSANDNDFIGQAAKQAASMNSAQRLSRIDELSQTISASKASPVSDLVRRVFDNHKLLLQGHVEPLEVLLPNDGLTKFYNVLEGLSDYHDLFATLGHNDPGLRVLELGAGTGGTSSKILNALRASNGTRMYSKYCYTDISSGFFIAAKKRFEAFSNIEFSVLDISKDPISQGFPLEGFDIIIAANVLHATPSINSTLKNVRKLIAPNGRLYLQELSPSVMSSVNFIMGILPGWWLGKNDNRLLEPYITSTRWDRELRDAGFLGTETVVHDDVGTYHLNANIIAQPAPTLMANGFKTTISVLGDATKCYELDSLLRSRGYQLEYFSRCDQVPPGQDIISTLELSNPFFDDISAQTFSEVQALAENLQNGRLLWLTKSSQKDCVDPNYGLVLGLARTLRAENSVDFNTLEIDDVNNNTWAHVVAVFDKIRYRHTDNTEQDIDPDYEFVLSNGVVRVGRYHAVTVPHELPSTSPKTAPKKLKIGKLGLLQSLSWEQQILLPEIGEDDLEVEPQYVGLNFRDVLTCMGIIEGSRGGFGLEASAIVRKVGKNVQCFVEGDRVMVFGSGCFSTRIQISSLLCAKIPDKISDEDAATMPTVYSTVVHSLIKLGNLQKGQTVLIHSACGGVGLAAIQLCRHLGVEVFVTAGNPEKVEFLRNTFDIPRNHIFNSRDESFLPDLMSETEGRGVDLVLNSLSGELLHASWKCVASGGRFVELGKRDFIGHGKLSMDIFEDNRSFFGVDLNRFTPQQCQPLLSKTLELVKEGYIKPINRTKVFNFTEVEEAFRYMQKGIHIGKVLVKMPGPQDEVVTTSSRAKITLHGNKTYLLVGGLGGLGRAISTWMIERGARHFIYLSRSAGSEKDRPFIRELEAQDCSVQTVAGTVTKTEDIQRAIAGAKKPIAGVLQMSMVLRDQLFAEHDFDDWHTVVDPKVQGTWNLHHALNDHDLDFFVLFSSISGTIGMKGQAAYAAANTFLDSFVSYRHRLDLPASVLDIGMMTEIGHVAESKELHGLLGARDWHGLRETDLIDALQLSIASNSPSKKSVIEGISNPSSLVIGLRQTRPLEDPMNRIPWKHDKRMSIYHNESSGPVEIVSSSNDGLRAFMNSIESSPGSLDSTDSFNFLSKLIGTQIYLFMMHPIEDLDISQTLSALGVDSLVTLEIRNWWKRSLGLETSTLEILGVGTIEGLAKLAVEGLKKKFGTAK